MIPHGFKPLLASPLELERASYPLLVSPKLDGIRCITAHDHVASRNLKPIPNRHICETLARWTTDILDGELVTYTDGKADDFNTCQSKIMRADGEPDFKFHVFDCATNPMDHFEDRLVHAHGACLGHDNLELVKHIHVAEAQALMLWEKNYVDAGYEGLMARRLDGPYKYGRSTAREGILTKLKRFDDFEVLVIDYTEQMHNANEATRDSLGRVERSSHKANMVPMGVLGSLTCETPDGAVTFEVGTGFTAEQRQQLWRSPSDLLGRTVKVKYQGLGPNKAPRFPVFLGFRDDGE